MLSGILLFSAILITMRSFPVKNTRAALGLYALGWYACGLIVAGFIPCDANCSIEEPTMIQIVHSIVGWTSYLLGVIGIFLLSPIIREHLPQGPLSPAVCKLLFCLAVSSFLVLNLTSLSPGLWQRVLEVSVFTWLILYTVQFSKTKQLKSF